MRGGRCLLEYAMTNGSSPALSASILNFETRFVAYVTCSRFPCLLVVSSRVAALWMMARFGTAVRLCSWDTIHSVLRQVEEGWVQCDDCQGWVHQICGLFNKGNNKDDAAFHCPECLEEGLRMGRRQVVSERPQSMMESADLTQCGLSTVLQAHLDQVVEVTLTSPPSIPPIPRNKSSLTKTW